jgi:hypothetical protein
MQTEEKHMSNRVLSWHGDKIPQEAIDWLSKRQRLAKSLKPKAYDMDSPWASEPKTSVKCRPRSSKIIWQGKQWAVTTYGIECRTHHYVIERDRLWLNEDEWGWLMQLAEKEWVEDLEEFAEVLRIARIVHDKELAQLFVEG